MADESIGAELRSALSDRYVIERAIGSGGMATVFLADDLKHRRKVAIKVLQRELAATIGADRFLREIEVAARLSHPHILPLYDSGAAGTLLYYVMPYVRGESLRQRLERERTLDVDAAVAIVRQVAAALEYAHGEAVIHRDIKPENILLHEGEAMVADFGIALVTRDTSGRLTDVGNMVGTPAYMSPEQALADRVDARSDVYSLGLVLYELLAGTLPHAPAHAQALLARRLSDSAPSIRKVRASVPVPVDQALAKALAFEPEDRFATVAEFAAALSRGTGDARVPCVAVLPLLNMSPDADNEYFADGITEDVIAQLSKVRALRVISRTSVMQFKKRERSLREIGAALDATTVLDGSVRRAGDRVRVVAQLLDVATERHLWSETYDRQLTDIFAIQSDLALQIATSLQAELTRTERKLIDKEPTRDVGAYQLFLQGRHAFLTYTGEGMRQSLLFYRQAIDRDPVYAMAHARLAQAYTELGETGLARPGEAYRVAREESLRALELDAEQSDVQCMAAYVKFVADFDWSGAEAAFKRALELAPGNADAYGLYGRMCASQGRHDTAVELQRRAHELDPVAYRTDLPTALLRAGRYDEALEMARRQVDLDPSYFRGHTTVGWALIKKGEHAAGIEHLVTAVRLDPGNTLWLGQLGQAYAISGDPGKAREILAQLEERARHGFVSPYHFAYVLTGLGEHDRALNYLEEAYDTRSGAIYGIKGSFLFEDLHGHPRFQALLRKMNLS